MRLPVSPLPIFDAAQNDRFEFVESLRGVAALLIVVFHVHIFFVHPQHFSAQPFGGAFKIGQISVDFFFVLSGFIIAHIHWRDLGRTGSATDYFIKRLTRIYPAYWFILAAVLAIQSFDYGLGSFKSFQTEHIVRAIVLLPQQRPVHWPVVVAWTLAHEILFYSVFGIAILNRRIGIAVLAAWLILIAVMAFWKTDLAPLRFLGSIHNIGFFFGMATAWALRRGLGGSGWIAVAAGGVVLVGIGALQAALPTFAPSTTLRLIYGAASAAVLLGAATLDRAHAVRVPRAVVALGAATYGIYLAHVPGISALVRLGAKLGVDDWIGVEAASLIVAAASIAVGIAFHAVIERRLTSMSRSTLLRLASRRARRRASGAPFSPAP